MKINFLLFLLAVITLNESNSQNNNKVFGYVEYEIFYPTKSKNPKATLTDFYFTNSESIGIDNKTTTNKGGIEQESEVINVKLPYGDALGAQIYRNLKDSILITRRPKNVISEPFIVKEKWSTIKWEIKDKTKQIGSYKATKAIGSFRGRDYSVWFTYEISVPFGPWKLHGLPGLILEGEDNETMMRFYAKTIKIPHETKSIIKQPQAENEISLKEEAYMQDNFDELLAKQWSARLPKGSSLKPIKNSDGRKYRVEKVYEWETDNANEKKN